MSDLLAQAEECRKLLRGFQSFAEVASALESVGTLEQAKNEAERQYNDLTGQISTAKDELASVKKSIKEALDKLKDKLEEEQIHSKAELDGLLLNARAEAGQVIADAKAEVLAAQDAVNKLQGEAQVLAEQNKQAVEDLSALQTNLDKVRAQANKLLGS